MKTARLTQATLLLAIGLSVTVALILVQPSRFGLGASNASTRMATDVRHLRAEVLSLDAQMNGLTGGNASTSTVTSTVRAVCQTITSTRTYGYTVELAADETINGYSSDFQDLVAALTRDCENTLRSNG